MKYILKYDEEQGILYFEVFEKFGSDDVVSFIDSVNNDFTLEQRRYLLTKISSPHIQILPDREGRQILRKGAPTLGFAKIAVCNANPSIRMFGKIIVTAVGKSRDTRFLETVDEGVAWLKTEKEKESKK